MKNIYFIIALITVFTGCKLKDQQPEQQQKLPDNTSAMNNKASNNATGWEKLNSGDATGATGTMGKQMEALNSTDRQKKYLADSIDRAMQAHRTRREDSLRQLRIRDSIASLSRSMAQKGSSGSGVRKRSAEPKEAISAAQPAIQNKKVAKFPEKDQNLEEAYSDGMDDFNTVVFKKKNKGVGGSDNTAPVADPGSNYTGKEKFDEVDISIPAVVHERSTVSTGGALSVKTARAAYIGQGITLPAGSIVTGFADFQDDRLNLRIRSINYNGRILRLSWKVYDTDGAEGIAVANATLKKNSSNGVNQTLNAAGQLITGSGAVGQVSSGMVRNIMSGSGRVSVSVESGKKLIIKSAN